MHSRQIHTKKWHIFCDTCAKRGITSQLVKFHINFEEDILLCINQDCLYPFDSGVISSFVMDKKSKETTLSIEAQFTGPVFSAGNNNRWETGSAGHSFDTQKKSKERTFLAEARPYYSASSEKNISGKEPSKGIVKLLNSKNTPTEEQRKRTLRNVKVDPFVRMDRKHFLFSSVGKDEGFVSVSAQRSKATVFEPYIPRRKVLYNSPPLASKRDTQDESAQLYVPVDLEQGFKELTNDEEEFLANIVFN